MEEEAFDLVEEAGGHGKDFQRSIMFDHENMHVEMEEPWDITTDTVEVELTPYQERLIAAANYTS